MLTAPAKTWKSFWFSDKIFQIGSVQTSVTAPYNYLHMYTYVVSSCIAHTCTGCNFTATSLLPVNKIGAMIKIWPSHDHLIIANHESIFSFIV